MSAEKYNFLGRLCINNTCFNRVQPYLKRNSNFRLLLENTRLPVTRWVKLSLNFESQSRV